jgi:hypothetical protein
MLIETFTHKENDDRAKYMDASTYLLLFLEELFEIGMIVFADQEQLLLN